MLALSACTKFGIPISSGDVSVLNDTPVAAPQQNDQVLRIAILNGRFSSNVYEEQSGATQMIVLSTGDHTCSRSIGSWTGASSPPTAPQSLSATPLHRANTPYTLT